MNRLSGRKMGERYGLGRDIPQPEGSVYPFERGLCLTCIVLVTLVLPSPCLHNSGLIQWARGGVSPPPRAPGSWHQRESFEVLNSEGLSEFNLHSAVSSCVVISSSSTIPHCVGISLCRSISSCVDSPEMKCEVSFLGFSDPT